MIWTRYLRVLTTLGLPTLALSTLATAGNEQNAYRGKFTLAVETHWEGITLPAGDYTFALQSNSVPYRLYIWGQGVGTIITATTTAQRVFSELTQVSLVDTAVGYTVRTFEVPELGVTFSHLTPTRKQLGHREARKKAVPKTALVLQGSENNPITSVVVVAVASQKRIARSTCRAQRLAAEPSPARWLRRSIPPPAGGQAG